MRLLDERLLPLFLPLGMIAALSACGIVGGGGDRPTTTAVSPQQQGPAADYPVVLGAPYTIDGTLYTPVDTMNYDAVGLATLDSEGGSAISAALRTLPLPSYVELTSLDTGRTILVRAERRGPMTGQHLVALSPGAMSQLGASEGTAVRVRRVNPPEQERAMLRRGEKAPNRMDTPVSLVNVLKRKLPGAAVPLAPASEAVASVDKSPVIPKAIAAVAVPASKHPAATTPAIPSPNPAQSMALPPLDSGAHSPVQEPARPVPDAAVAGSGAFVVQAGAYSSKDNADRAASQIGGMIDRSGPLYRVRTGPFPDRRVAEASLAKVQDAGYSGARIYSVE